MRAKGWEVEGTMAHAEYCAIRKALLKSNYNVAQAAATLAVGRTTMYRMMLLYGITKSSIAPTSVNYVDEDGGSDLGHSSDASAESQVSEEKSATEMARLAKSLIASNFRREKTMGGLVGSDYRLSALLYLYISRASGVKVTANGCAKALNIAPSSCSTYLNRLVEAGIVVTHSDGKRSSAKYFKLSDSGLTKLISHLRNLSESVIGQSI